MNTLAGGIIVGAALSHMLPTSEDSIDDYFVDSATGVTTNTYPYAGLIAGGSLMILIVIDKTALSRYDKHGNQVGHSHSAPDVPGENGHEEGSSGDSDDSDDDDEEEGAAGGSGTVRHRRRANHHHHTHHHHNIYHSNEEVLPYDPILTRATANGSIVSTVIRKVGRVRRHSISSTSQAVNLLEESTISCSVTCDPNPDCSTPNMTQRLSSSQLASSDSTSVPANGAAHAAVQVPSQPLLGAASSGDAQRTSYGSVADPRSPDQTPLLRNKQDSKLAKKHMSPLEIRAYLFTIALSVHSLFEGLGMGAETTESGLLSLIVAVVAHKAIEAFSLGVSVYFAKMNRTRSLCILIGYSLVTPVGIAVGMGAAQSAQGPVRDLIEGILTAVAAGSFLYISLIELIPSELQSNAGVPPPPPRKSIQHDSPQPWLTRKKALWIKILCLVFGWGIMALIAEWA
ncbi:solute carrier family 39 [Capsaspora owczarzaki ATCC 30864]|nr:solute carrier family 39 [Capsaspora owczarzaki ATCC 30864]